jgi:putative endopeptidase
MSQIGRALARLTIAALLSISAIASGVEPSAATAPVVGHGVDVGGIDRTATPGDDFFRYANGAWLKATQIPPDRSSYGTDAMLSELSTQRVADLLRNTAANPAPAAS